MISKRDLFMKKTIYRFIRNIN